MTMKSMTAFARIENQTHWGNIVCELRSVNHRYLDLSLRLPEIFYPFEMQIREQIRRDIQRGKVELYLRIKTEEMVNTEIRINRSLVTALYQATSAVNELFHLKTNQINALEILNWPGVLMVAKIDMEQAQKDITEMLEKLLIEFAAVRAREGQELKKLFLERLEKMQIQLRTVRDHLPEIELAQRNKLIERFHLAKVELEPSRLEQELVLFAQKIDVSEELDRLSAHITEVTRVLNTEGAVGRRLDFLMQELNREANTLGAKSVNVATTRASVELKVLIEQMREQVQNVE